MPKGSFDYYEVPGFVVGKGDQEQTYRFESTGRGKAKTERWQRQERVRISIDGYTVSEVITVIQDAAEGLSDTYVNNTAHGDGGWEGHWIETSVSGWVDVVVGTKEIVNAHEEIIAVKRYVTETYERQQAALNDERGRAEAELKQLAYRYPDLVAQYATQAAG